MMEYLRNHPVIRFFSSYLLGIAALLFMMLLLVIGTLYQEHWGIYRAKNLFFDSWVFLYPLSKFIRSLPEGTERALADVSKMGLAIPLPGNRLLTLVLFVNLLLATVIRMRFRPQIIGVYIVHVGILILIGGAFVTNFWSYHSYMRIPEGEASNYSARYHRKEIALVRALKPGEEEVISLANLENLKNGTELLAADHEAPFTVKLVGRYDDSVVDNDPDGNFAKANGINHGFTQRIKILKADLTANPDATPMAAVVEVAPESGGEPMRFILSDMLTRPVEIEVDGQTWKCELRDYRHYYPFTVYLRDFQHEKHAGTSMASSYASEITFVLPEENVEKDVRIYMNHPLRHKLFTFYQQSFEQGDKVTVLAVVKNPGMPVPYIATVVIAIGLLWQFIGSLGSFRSRAAGSDGA